MTHYAHGQIRPIVGGRQGENHIAAYIWRSMVNCLGNLNIGLSVNRNLYGCSAANSSIGCRKTYGIGKTVVTGCTGIGSISETAIRIKSHISLCWV